MALLVVGATGFQTEIFVAPNGSDRNPGTSRLPLATLAAARDLARSSRCHQIVLKGGVYRVLESVKLDGADNELTIRAASGPRPLLSGGLNIPLSAIHPCKDATVLSRIIDTEARDKVLELDLKALGISSIATIEPRGFPHPANSSPNELFQGDSPMNVARWPNTGYAKVGKVTESGNGEHDHDKPKRMPVFSIGERSKGWLKAEEPWMYGYWKFDWADESIRVKNIDPATGTITLQEPAVYGVDSGVPFFAENLLEELDAPGEFYVDRQTSRLYFIPLHPLSAKEPLTLSITSQPFITVTDAANVTVRGVDFGFSRGTAVRIHNGDHVTFEGCRFKDLGGRVGEVELGHDSGFRSCDIRDTAEGGVALSGGDRKFLRPAHNFVMNCEFQNFERRSQTYRPAVWIDGVGNVVSHCYMHDAPHSAIIYGGNDHVIENNRFSRLLALTGDGGVVYTGRNWTARGTIIRNNWFEDDFGQRKWEPAIYVDDLGSGIKMIGNLIERCHWGFLIGGGRDNILEGNILVDCDLAFDCDARGLGWAASSRPTMVAGLEAVPYQSAIWRTQYPNLPNILNENPMAPAANALRNNVLLRSGTTTKQMEAPFKNTATIEGNRESATISAMDQAQIKKKRENAGLVKDRLRDSLKGK